MPNKIQKFQQFKNGGNLDKPQFSPMIKIISLPDLIEANPKNTLIQTLDYSQNKLSQIKFLTPKIVKPGQKWSQRAIIYGENFPILIVSLPSLKIVHHTHTFYTLNSLIFDKRFIYACDYTTKTVVMFNYALRKVKLICAGLYKKN